MMQRIGDEMAECTSAISLEQQGPAVLDLCAAPGGFIATVLKYNPSATVCGISLPNDLGGHQLLVKHGKIDPRVTIRYMDITWLGTEFGLEPSDFTPPNLTSEQPFLGQSFDLVFCDGQVLRTHAQYRDQERERHEPRRLTCSQMILALQRIREGGTLIMLLHKAEAWNTMQILHTFSGFADVELFKAEEVPCHSKLLLHDCHQREGAFSCCADCGGNLEVYVERGNCWTMGHNFEGGLRRRHQKSVSKKLVGCWKNLDLNLSGLLNLSGQIQRDGLSRKTWTR